MEKQYKLIILIILFGYFTISSFGDIRKIYLNANNKKLPFYINIIVFLFCLYFFFDLLLEFFQ